MPGPRYCILCGDPLQGGRVDRRYCGANCRTRACRMRQRGEPISPKGTPQPVSLASLLSNGVPCPCCGVRIVLHATANQAGVPKGYTATAIRKGLAGPSLHRHASRPAQKPPRGEASPSQRAQAKPRPSLPAAWAEKPDRLHNKSPAPHPRPRQSPGASPKSSPPSNPARPEVSHAARSRQEPAAKSERRPQPHSTSGSKPRPTPNHEVRTRQSPQTAPPPSPISTRAPRPSPSSTSVLPHQIAPAKSVTHVAAGFLDQGNLRLPGYADICNDSHGYIVAAATTKVRGNPWQINGQVLETLAADVLTEIEKKLEQFTHGKKYMVAEQLRL